MFKRENRLVPGISFSNSNFSTSSQFVLKERGNGFKINRFGIVVSKKIDKSAVGRNKIKRFFREALIEINKTMRVGHDILLIVKKEVLTRTESETRGAIINALAKLKLIK